MAHLNY